MEDYKVTQTGDEIQEILNQSPLDTASIADLEERLSDVEGKIPSEASEDNRLADKEYVDDSISETADELTALINSKANAADVYTKSETYNKTELDSMITTPDVQYVSVTATAQTTSVTDVLPATGTADTVYRVGSWDGTQYDAASYSEYSWNGSAYVLLNVKNTGIATGSDFDNPTAAQRELLTTVGAVLDGCDATPTAESVKPVQSGGVVEMYGGYIDNSEYVYVKTDNEDKILWAIKKDGSVFYGAGCPQQVKDYIQQKIDELSLDEYEDIVAFLSDYLGSDTTLKTLIDSKLDGEGLDDEALGTVKVVQTPEYIQATTDSEDKILEGITNDGVKHINIPTEIGKATIQNIDSNKWIQVLIDSNGRIIEGITAEGKKKIFVPTDIDGLDEDVQNIIETDFPNKATIDKFSESDGKLMWNGSPIASEASISTLVVDLPVSDGTDISSGYAYIDSTDRTIKVKA